MAASKSIYVFLYGTWGITNALQILDVSPSEKTPQNMWPALLRGYGRSFVGPDYLPSVQQKDLYEIGVHLPRDRFDAVFKQHAFYTRLQLSPLKDGAHTQVRGPRDAIVELVNLMKTSEPPVSFGQPSACEIVSGLLVRVTDAQLAALHALRGALCDAFEYSVAVTLVGKKFKRNATVWVPKQPHNWVRPCQSMICQLSLHACPRVPCVHMFGWSICDWGCLASTFGDEGRQHRWTCNCQAVLPDR
jgi:hypothetical protein